VLIVIGAEQDRALARRQLLAPVSGSIKIGTVHRWMPWVKRKVTVSS
jgi:hypothetical protein